MQHFENGIEFLNKIKVIFYALIGGPLLLFLVLFFMNKEGKLSPLSPQTLPDTAALLIGVFCIVLAIASYIIYSRKLKVIRQGTTLRSRLSQYFKANIAKFTMQTVACIIPILCFVVTNNTMFQGFYVLLMVLMAISNPTIYSLLNHLRLNKEDARIMKNNESIE